MTFEEYDKLTFIKGLTTATEMNILEWLIIEHLNKRDEIRFKVATTAYPTSAFHKLVVSKDEYHTLLYGEVGSESCWIYEGTARNSEGNLEVYNALQDLVSAIQETNPYRNVYNLGAMLLEEIINDKGN